MRVLMPLPDRDVDTTEVAVPWRLLRDRGHEVVFATEHGGSTPEGDQRLLDGGIFGKLGAESEPSEFYRRLTESSEVRAPAAGAETAPPAPIDQARHRERRRSGVRGRRRPLRVGALAGRRVSVRAPVRCAARGGADVRRGCFLGAVETGNTAAGAGHHERPASKVEGLVG